MKYPTFFATSIRANVRMTKGTMFLAFLSLRGSRLSDVLQRTLITSCNLVPRSLVGFALADKRSGDQRNEFERKEGSGNEFEFLLSRQSKTGLLSHTLYG